MACTRPLKGWRSAKVGENGKRGVVFNHRDAFTDLPVEVPCGVCVGCRMERARHWAVRIMHEAKSHESSIFATLTYRDESLPSNGSLEVRDLQLFFKRLRKAEGSGIRYFAAGEYGEQTKRPHYHAIVFGYSPRDGFEYRGGQHPLLLSPQLDKLWGRGQCVYGALTFETAAYVAQYSVKKVSGAGACDYYRSVDWSSGEMGYVRPEFCVMSLRPAIGRTWIDKWRQDVFPRDFVISQGRQVSPPRYYFKRLESEDPDLADAVRAARAAEFASRPTLSEERIAVIDSYNSKILKSRSL